MSVEQQHAERELEEVEALLEVIEEELGEVEEELGRRRRVVTVDNKDSGDTIRIRARVEATIGQVISKMYDEFRAAREATDRLGCKNSGEDVFAFETLTIERYVAEGHCPKLHWDFAGDTGGA
jgi:DNA gyrase/topoisomerase IV subunit A